MALRSRTILVAGGGITGLTSALGLAAAGFRVELFEQSPSMQTAGAGLQLSPNALSVLDDLGLGRRIRMLAVAPSSIRIRNARSGAEIARVPLGETAMQRYGLPYLVMHRADLMQTLVSAVKDNPDIAIRYGQSLEDMASHAHGVTGLIRKGAHMDEIAGAAVIAADGVWSRLRRRHFGAPPAQYSGFTAWRAVVNAGRLPGSFDMESTQLFLGPDAHAVAYPIRVGRAVNVVIVMKAPLIGEGWAEPALAADLASPLKGWNKDIRLLLSGRDNWTKYPIFAAPPTRAWARGNAALAGDAAHAMVPFAAQGAAMGIEDAAVLTACLAKARDGAIATAAALAEYERTRRGRVRRASQLADRNRMIYHLGWPWSAARNAAMAWLGAEKLLARQDWLYSWRAEPLPDAAGASLSAGSG
jgi:salicylate hydroxylase